MFFLVKLFTSLINEIHCYRNPSYDKYKPNTAVKIKCDQSKASEQRSLYAE